MAVTADVRLVNCGEGFSRSGLERSLIEEAVSSPGQLPVRQSSVQGAFRAGFRVPEFCQGL